MLFIGIAIISVFYILFYPADGRVEIGDTMAYHTLASNLKHFGTFGERFHVVTPGLHVFHTMPSGELISTTFRPPGYSAFLALLYFASENYYFIAIIQSLLAIFSLVLFYKLVNMYFCKKVALISLGLYALLPAFYQLNISFWSESFTQSILIISIYLFLTGRRIIANLIIPSLLLSWVILSRPTYAVYLLVILVLLVINYFRYKTIEQWLLAIFVVTIIPITIWSVRCSYVTKKPVFISSTTGINFFLSNNPYVINGRASTWPSPEYLKQNGINVFRNDYNDAVLNQQTTKSGLKWIKDNPWLFMRLIPNRLVYFFAPITNNFMPRGVGGHLPRYVLEFITVWSNVLGYILIFFSIIGMWFLPRKKLLLWLLPYLAIIAVTYPENRYFFPFVLPMSVLAAYGLISVKEIKKVKVALLMAVILTIYQLNYFLPNLYRHVVLSSNFFSKHTNLINFANKNPEKTFIADSTDVYNGPNVVIKKPPVGNQEFFTLSTEGKLVTESEIILKIENSQIYTNLPNPFSGLDKNLYPKLANQNALVFDHFDNRSVFKIAKEGIGKSDINSISHSSDRPNQISFIDDFVIEKGKTLLVETTFSSRGKVVICDQNYGNCFDLVYLAEADNFVVNILIDANKFPGKHDVYKIGIVNYVNFPQPNNYNILFTGTRANFTPSGVIVKINEANK